MAQPMPITCPQCGLYKWTRKVSAVYNEGKFDKQSMGMSTYGTHYMSRGTTQSALSTRLSPPMRPDTLFTGGTFGIVALSLIAIVMCLCALLSAAPNLMLPAMAASMEGVEGQEDLAAISGGANWSMPIMCGGSSLLAFAGIIPIFIASRKNNQAKEQAWKQGRARWERLYYCGGCDITFDPGLNK